MKQGTSALVAGCWRLAGVGARTPPMAHSPSIYGSRAYYGGRVALPPAPDDADAAV